MTTLVNKIKGDSVQAMKDKTPEGKAKLSTLRLLVAELEKEKVAHKLSELSGLSDKQAEVVISRQIKKLDKEIEAYVAVNRETTKQETEKALLLTYLPKQLTEIEIRQEIVHAVNLVNKGEIKNAMQYLGSKLNGKADMKLVQELVSKFDKK